MIIVHVVLRLYTRCPRRLRGLKTTSAVLWHMWMVRHKLTVLKRKKISAEKHLPAPPPPQNQNEATQNKKHHLEKTMNRSNKKKHSNTYALRKLNDGTTRPTTKNARKQGLVEVRVLPHQKYKSKNKTKTKTTKHAFSPMRRRMLKRKHACPSE